MPKWSRRRSAKPILAGSSPAATSNLFFMPRPGPALPFSLPQRQRAFQIYEHLSGCVGLPQTVPLYAVQPEFGVTHFYAPRGQVGERKTPIAIGRSAANYGRVDISLSMQEIAASRVIETVSLLNQVYQLCFGARQVAPIQ